MECIVHYKNIKFSKKLIAVTESSFKTLKESKRIREELGGENLHYEQSIKIPNEFKKYKLLFYHRECRAKFTNAQTLLKRKSDQDEGANKSSKKRPKRNDTFFFPNHCMFCKKVRITVKKRKLNYQK